MTYKYVIEAPSPSNPTDTVKFGLRSDTFEQYRNRSLHTSIAEYFAIVRDGLATAKHCFRGVSRPMADGNAMDVDQRVIVYTWRSLFAAFWVGSQFDGYWAKRAAPPGCVFAVLVREEVIDGEGIVGSIERWNWIEEDSGLPQAPIDWGSRYGKKLWSKI